MFQKTFVPKLKSSKCGLHLALGKDGQNNTIFTACSGSRKASDDKVTKNEEGLLTFG